MIIICVYSDSLNDCESECLKLMMDDNSRLFYYPGRLLLLSICILNIQY